MGVQGLMLAVAHLVGRGQEGLPNDVIYPSQNRRDPYEVVGGIGFCRQFFSTRDWADLMPRGVGKRVRRFLVAAQSCDRVRQQGF